MLTRNNVLLAAALAFVLLLPAPSAAARELSTPESALFDAINAARTAHGRAALSMDMQLLRTARSHSIDMLRRHYFGHGAFTRRVRANGAAGPRFGENLAWAVAASAQWIVGEWLASPTHRAILLRPGFRRVGIGSVRGPFAGRSGATVVTADFAGR
jgi:uncharacterized protein YkwD